jgi:hypothetical protein
MHDGRIIAMGSPTELKQTYQEPTIEEVFIKLIRQNKM